MERDFLQGNRRTGKQFWKVNLKGVGRTEKKQGKELGGQVTEHTIGMETKKPFADLLAEIKSCDGNGKGGGKEGGSFPGISQI